jgi:hypothetical protein
LRRFGALGMSVAMAITAAGEAVGDLEGHSRQLRLGFLVGGSFWLCHNVKTETLSSAF